MPGYDQIHKSMMEAFATKVDAHEDLVNRMTSAIPRAGVHDLATKEEVAQLQAALDALTAEVKELKAAQHPLLVLGNEVRSWMRDHPLFPAPETRQ